MYQNFDGFITCSTILALFIFLSLFPQIADALWWYYFSKFIEFFDTVS